MNDPIDIVGGRIAYWTGVNHPLETNPKFYRSESNMRVEAKGDIQYGSVVPSKTRPVTLKSSVFVNDTAVANKQTFTVNETTSETFSWSFKEGLKLGLKFSAKLPLIGKAGVTAELNFEATQTHTDVKTKGWAYSFDINVPARSRIETSFVIEQSDYNISFIAPVQVRGTCVVKSDQTFYRWDIADLMGLLRWDAATFDAAPEGTFSAVQGDRYLVTAKQFPPSPENAEAVSSSIIDAGVMQDDKIIRFPLPS
jgi:hypothetical protein